jgi:hypothetical protein
MITGDKKITLNGMSYILRFDWRALAEIEKDHGESPNLFRAATLASVAAAGFRRYHPELTAERIADISPPLAPFARAVQEALQWAYFGDEAVPADTGEKKTLGRGSGPLSWLLCKAGLTRSSSGG